jgi:hypothetical protein
LIISALVLTPKLYKEASLGWERSIRKYRTQLQDCLSFWSTISKLRSDTSFLIISTSSLTLKLYKHPRGFPWFEMKPIRKNGLCHNENLLLLVAIIAISSYNDY